ncbi:HAD domain-containing protein [Apibacter raozihei]|uniref:HAD domain-containing protein n=1 Tax=Apibacter raozihei TaxID=2500547 RepID=UPI000FE2A2FB|nr:HAD domain-containing protein [Apibacter raozihei]
MHILLDIDGVMVSAASWKKPEVSNDGFYIFKDIAVESLNKIIKATNASIILTTSHRFRFTLEQWNKVFASRNIFVSVDRFES